MGSTLTALDARRQRDQQQSRSDLCVRDPSNKSSAERSSKKGSFCLGLSCGRTETIATVGFRDFWYRRYRCERIRAYPTFTFVSVRPSAAAHDCRLPLLTSSSYEVRQRAHAAISPTIATQAQEYADDVPETETAATCAGRCESLQLPGRRSFACRARHTLSCALASVSKGPTPACNCSNEVAAPGPSSVPSKLCLFPG
jgi:hypothetical protein